MITVLAVILFVRLFNESYLFHVCIVSTHSPSICDTNKVVWYKRQCFNVSQAVHASNKQNARILQSEDG